MPDAAPPDAAADAPDAGPQPPACGDGTVDPGEQCDDGNRMSSDGCSSECVLESDSWKNLTPNPMPPRAGHAMAYDSARDRVVLFGGTTTQPTSDTWEWDGATWTLLAPPHVPPARTGAAMVFDSARSPIVL